MKPGSVLLSTTLRPSTIFPSSILSHVQPFFTFVVIIVVLHTMLLQLLYTHNNLTRTLYVDGSCLHSTYPTTLHRMSTKEQ